MANPNEFNQPVSFLNGGPFLTTWGPYPTKEAACLALKNEVDADGRNMRSGKTVAIGTVTDYVECIWQGGFEDEHLVEHLGYLAEQESLDNLNEATKLAQRLVEVFNEIYKYGILSSDNKVILGIDSNDRLDIPAGLSDRTLANVYNSLYSRFSADITPEVKDQLGYSEISSVNYKWGLLSSDNKVLFGVTNDDKIYAPSGFSSETMSLLISSLSASLSEAITESVKTTLGYKEIQNSTYKWGILSSDDKVLLAIDKDDKIVGELLDLETVSNQVLEIINVLENITSNVVLCAGDSLTNNGVMVSRLQTLLGSSFLVANEGVGGESVPSICARLGSVPAYIPNGFTLPADTSPVVISTYSSRLLNVKYNKSVSPLLQSVSSRLNPVFVRGVECTITWTGSSLSDVNGTWTLKRNAASLAPLYIEPKTLIYPVASKKYRKTRAVVYWMGQNAGYDTPAQLVEYLKYCIEFHGTNNYVIVGLHTLTPATRADLEKEMTEAFGLRYLNLREYMSKYALDDMGIIPTAEDITAKESGTFPPSFWSSPTDSVHMNTIGYTAVANQVYKIFTQLGYF